MYDGGGDGFREKNRSATVKKSKEGHGQHVVRANAHKDLVTADALIVGDGIHQPGGGRVRVQPEILNSAAHFLHLRGRRVRVLIGVQFYDIGLFRLFAGHVRYDLTDIFHPFFHYPCISCNLLSLAA